MALPLKKVPNRRRALVVTHDEKIIPTFKRIHHIRDGRTFEEAGEGRPLENQPKPS